MDETTIFDKLLWAGVELTLGCLLVFLVNKIHPKKRGLFPKIQTLFKCFMWALVFILIATGLIIPFMSGPSLITFLAVVIPLAFLPIMFAAIFIFISAYGIFLVFFFKNYPTGIFLIFTGIGFLAIEISLLLTMLCPENSINCQYQQYASSVTDFYINNIDKTTKIGIFLAAISLAGFVFKKFKLIS